jgi:hypothetical protein
MEEFYQISRQRQPMVEMAKSMDKTDPDETVLELLLRLEG